MRQILLPLALILIITAALFADDSLSPKIENPKSKIENSSLLKINDADPAAQAAISLDNLLIAATIDGPLARTSITLTFRNNLPRQLEGELEFPLPQGATVSGYAFDVPIGSGILIDGVPVEKERARQIFETEVRRGIDPGIVEQTRGNNFRTRIHPIPANGTRTVRITYVSDITSTKDAATFTIPLDFKTALKSATIRIDLLGLPSTAKPTIDGLASVAFVPTPTGLTAEQHLNNVTLTGQLTVNLPPLPFTLTRIEPRLPIPSPENPTPDPAKAETYFLISTILPFPSRHNDVSLNRITILWDTSLSRLEADKSAELAFLKSLTALKPNLTVDVVTTTASAGKTFTLTRGNSDDLIAYLNGLTYDGALRIDNIAASQNDADLCLFFTDGLITLGEERFAKTTAPVYTICSDPKANHPLLNQLATESSKGGGLYYNLQRTKPADAAASILAPRETVTLTANENEIADLYPKGPIPITIPSGTGDRINITGKLLTKTATLTLTTSRGSSRTITLSRDEQLAPGSAGGSGDGNVGAEVQNQNPRQSRGLIPLFWANQKIAYLSARPDANTDALLAVGKEFNLVTPNTSLIVLETVDQYLRYRIVPPKTAPELYKQFIDRIENETREKERQETAKIVRTLVLWQTRVQWWEKKFEVPKDFIYKDKGGETSDNNRVAMQNMATGASPGSLFSDGEAAASQPAPAAPNAPAPPPVHARGERQGLGSASPPAPAGEATLAKDAAKADNVGGITPPSFNLSDITEGADIPVMGKDAKAINIASAAAITLKPWSPDTPYLKAMAAAPAEKAYQTYLDQRKDYLHSPAFYLDCANFFLDKKQNDIAIRILTNIAQLRMESAPLLRVAAYRLLQLGQYDLAIDLFEKAKKLRPDEPQSWRDLALAISEFAMNRTWRETEPDFKMHEWRVNQVLHALELYNHVILNRWERFDEIEVITLMEANALWNALQQDRSYALISRSHPIVNPLDPRLVKNLDCDIRIVLAWDADNTDIDLHVLEPTGEEAFYSHPLTTIGGHMSKDFTQGYGPEEYCLHHARPGTYTVRAHYFGSSQQTLTGPVTLHATIFTNFARPNQSQQSLTLRLATPKDFETLGEIKFQAP
ncbi:MAG: DUF2135 domain-containing protein [Phycisphaerales bacterium]|nr:DUF2135 domain-containing protein [Phycisphaerales bacterium]